MNNNLTELEIQVLEQIEAEDGNGEYILNSDTKSQYLSILSIKVSNKKLRGVLSSLIKKGFINIIEEEESLLKLTNKAVQYYNGE